MYAPIALFVYNRPWHTKQTIEALQKNKLAQQSQLFIFSDGPKNEQQIDSINDVRKYIKTIDSFSNVTIVERKKNLGLTNSIISGITEVVNKYGRIIVLEDDLITAPYFLQFMNDALDFYKDEITVGCIHGYVYPVKKKFNENFFSKDAGCWGWATWGRAWCLYQPNGLILLDELLKRGLSKKFDFDGTYPFTQMLRNQVEGRLDTWDIQWQASLFLNNKLTLYPFCSLVKNIGHDFSGTHCGKSSVFDVELYQHEVSVHKINIEESVIAFKEYKIFFRKLNKKNFFQIIRKFKYFLKRLTYKIVERIM